MSVAVSLEELPATLAQYPWGYLVTVSPSLRAHSLAVPTEWRDGVLRAAAGGSTRANVEARPHVTMVFPHPEPGRFSLIVDGDATVVGERVVVAPTAAVLHRPAR